MPGQRAVRPPGCVYATAYKYKDSVSKILLLTGVVRLSKHTHHRSDNSSADYLEAQPDYKHNDHNAKQTHRQAGRAYNSNEDHPGTDTR